jgi:hypothetical protein
MKTEEAIKKETIKKGKNEKEETTKKEYLCL